VIWRTLTSQLKREAPIIGLDVGRLDALQVELGRIMVTEGIGARIQEAQVGGRSRLLKFR
jgi:hypothetical protein